MIYGTVLRNVKKLSCVFLFVKDGDLSSWFTTFSEAKASAAPIFLRKFSHFNLFPYWQHRWFIQK
jgi:hypothetical protein